MNYIQQINAFYEWLDSNPLPPASIALWHALMQINNRCRWSGEFTVAISTLETKTGYHERALYQARAVLVAKGRIRYGSNGSKQAATYGLIPFTGDGESAGYRKEVPVSSSVAESLGRVSPRRAAMTLDAANACSDSPSDPCGYPCSDPCSDLCSHDVPINKQNKTRQNNNKEPKGSMSSCDDPAKFIRKIFDDYNQICKNLPAVKVLTSRRALMVGARLHEHGYETVRQMLLKAGASNFLAGDNNRKWMATFDWLFGPCNFAKVLEGNYDNDRFMKSEKPGFVGKPSPMELLEEVYNNIQQDGESN